MRDLITYNKFVWTMYNIYGLTNEELLKVWDENGMILEFFTMRGND